MQKKTVEQQMVDKYRDYRHGKNTVDDIAEWLNSLTESERQRSLAVLSLGLQPVIQAIAKAWESVTLET
jgi:hypothetical protein